MGAAGGRRAGAPPVEYPAGVNGEPPEGAGADPGTECAGYGR